MSTKEQANALCIQRGDNPNELVWDVDAQGFDKKFTKLKLAERELNDLELKLMILGVKIGETE